ncbi:MAG TPA: IPT/TIG domain-containing protein [Planctomycetota bacterium]|nr:IPT/TIG domain-containing protein [Planctomycetota bacterium]
MSVIRHAGWLVALGVLLAPDSQAQISTSPGFQLVDFVFDSGGGGSASLGYAAHASLGASSGGKFGSAHKQAGLGILETSDPQPTNEPVVFALTPAFGPKAGGSVVTISGLNFDKFGVGPSVTVDIGGNAATSVNVISNTLLTAVVPAGISGPKAVTVSSSFGSNVQADGYVYTPAITTTANSAIGETFVMRNYGTPGHVYRTYVSTVPTSAATHFGTLLIGPFPLVQLLPQLPYPGPDGISTFTLVVPFNPVLVGLTIWFQSLDISQLSPLAGELTNASTTSFP